MFPINSLIVFAVCGLVAAQDVPASPCPDAFHYSTRPNGEVFGRITLPYDDTTALHLGVNASMKGYHTDNRRVKLTVKMVTPGADIIQHRTSILNYDLEFPFQNVVPKITQIQYNGRTYCTGPPEQLVAGTPGVTSLWAGHNYYFQPTGNSVAPATTGVEHPQPPTVEANLQAVEPNQRIPELPVSKAAANQNVECGVSRNVIVPLILGGTEVADGMFPWLAAMFAASGNGYQYKCTGNLVSRKHVITAARCVSFFKIQLVSTEDVLFVFGKSKLKNWATSGAVTRGAAAISTNPDFDANSGHGDISVITLDRPVDFSRSIAPICLWEGDSDVDTIVSKTGTVAGWGADEAAQKSGHYSVSVAKSLDIPVVSTTSCLYSNFTYYQLTSDSTFCAGKRDGTGTCIGDSGAGFMMLKNQKFYLRGVMSLVLSDAGKCDLANFMVFCDVAKVLDWVKKSMAN
ncbi:hypothetical protein HUJ04_000340 [Dendroctonus ponderosae]|uniref:Peptidase S1 domain-containing protein n=1 Tax=Dendroctonus ponderosae TaxID=77166 RepID=A0AAR5PP52_DENPD|nr:hypothetical protein HUJ04_000340 [Dendroctonus ponderosae]